MHVAKFTHESFSSSYTTKVAVCECSFRHKLLEYNYNCVHCWFYVPDGEFLELEPIAEKLDSVPADAILSINDFNYNS